MHAFKFTLPLGASPQHHFYSTEDMNMKIWQLDMILEAPKFHGIPLDIWCMLKLSKLEMGLNILKLFSSMLIKKINELSTRS